MKIYPDDWKIKLTTGLVSAACVLAAMLLFGTDRLWSFMLAIVVAVIVGNFLGLLVYRLLFRPAEIGKKDENT
jgi:hypothetical protein